MENFILDNYILTQNDIPKLISLIEQGDYCPEHKPYNELDNLSKHIVDNIDSFLITRTGLNGHYVDCNRFAFYFYAKNYPTNPKTIQLGQNWIDGIKQLFQA